MVLNESESPSKAINGGLSSIGFARLILEKTGGLSWNERHRAGAL